MIDLKNFFQPDQKKIQFLKDFLNSSQLYNNPSILNDKLINPTYRSIFQEAIINLNCFINYPYIETNNIIISAKKFSQLILINPKRTEPYIYLAWLYFIADDNSSSYEYLKKAEKINPRIPFIYELKQNLIECLNPTNILNKEVKF